MRTDPDNNAILFTPEDARKTSDAVADVLCWFAGFSAAKPDAILPPGIDNLRDLNIALKGLIWEKLK